MFKSTAIVCLFVGLAFGGGYGWARFQASRTQAATAASAATEEGHDEHAHGDENANSVPLTDQARANLKLQLGPIGLGRYQRQLVLPGVVVEQPGHSERRITTSLPGVITRVHALPGQTVRPGDPLFDLQPTGELLTNAQSELLKSLQEIELVNAELKRLAPLVENGSIPARTKIEKEYELRRLESQKLVQIQELMVRGLSPQQITEMVEHKVLLREFTVYVPGKQPAEKPHGNDHTHHSVVPAVLIPERTAESSSELTYTLERINVFPGKLVNPGEELCDLALHTDLYLEGFAFERDSRWLADAVQHARPIEAVFESDEQEPLTRTGLQIRFVDNNLDPQTRTLKFYIPLKNEVLRDNVAGDGIVYRSWRFKPGQKVKLLLPIEEINNVFVVPAEAVVIEGPEAFVFRAAGENMDRIPVVIAERDPRQIAIRNDGHLFPGDQIALNQAYQIQLALKQQQGSGIDPHAGHNH